MCNRDRHDGHDCQLIEVFIKIQKIWSERDHVTGGELAYCQTVTAMLRV